MAKERQSKVVVGKIHISHWAKDKLEDRLRLLLSTKKKYEQKGGRKADNFYWTFSNFIEMNPEDFEQRCISNLYG